MRRYAHTRAQERDGRRLHAERSTGKIVSVDTASDSLETRERFMRRAISLARHGWGTTDPNPMVGALVALPDGTVAGEGWHEKAGGPHAEVNALHAAGECSRGATLYVTLEPCSTFGRTPPCTEAIVRAGIKHVVIGATDPNPLHAGRGFEILRAEGIDVTSGVLADDCDDLNPIFNHWITAKTTLFAGKIATTLDGRIATRAGASKWITGPAARENAHIWRRYYPAIAVGSGTVLSDNPHLTSRLQGADEFCPRRFVFDRSLRTARVLPLPELYTDKFRELTTVVTALDAPPDAVHLLENQGAHVLCLPACDDATFWAAFRKFCANNGITGILFEGGSHLLSSLLVNDQMDYLYAYRAPVILADGNALAAFDGAATEKIADGWRLEKVRGEQLGEDQLMRGWIAKP
jgi:diaminohydroxyphosphoribosylaminopyrimidine deaminase / 5-amino-6-(5-phosphoribosylamino)uracil reductase